MTDDSDKSEDDLLHFPDNKEMQQIANEISAAREEIPTFCEPEEKKESTRPNLSKYSSFRGMRTLDHTRDDESLSDYLSNSLHGSLHGSKQVTDNVSDAEEETPTVGEPEVEKESSRPNLSKYSSFRGIRAPNHARDDESLSDYLSNSMHGSMHDTLEEDAIEEKQYEAPSTTQDVDDEGKNEASPTPQDVTEEKQKEALAIPGATKEKQYKVPTMSEPPLPEDEDTSVSSDSGGADMQQEAQRKVHLPTSIRIRVLESWDLVEQDLDKLGMDFFMTIFRKHPQMKDLFRFGGTKTEDLPKNPMLKAHANGVMKTVGVALAGLEDVEALIPVLRNLGLRHSQVGVMPEHYDAIYSILIGTIKKHIGKDKWNKEIEQAWEVCYGVIASVMKDPSRHIEVEPAEGWGMWNGIVCAYLAIVTPLQLAGFGSVLFWRIVFELLNVVAIGTCLLDFGSGYLQRVVALKNSSGRSLVLTILEQFRWWFPLKFRIHRMIRRLRLSRWTPWTYLDLLVMSSFLASSLLPSWTPLSLVYIVGLARILALARSIHVVRCAELLSLKKPGARKEYFHFVQLAQLGMALCYMIHLFGCMHCMVITISGVEAERYSPALRILDSNTHSFNKYLHGLYWAFVNVAGIGNYDSVPVTSMQIIFTMVVHWFGATLYAIAVGNIFAILEARSRAFSKVTEGVASLKDFMQKCNIPEPSQDSFLSSYLMHTLVANRERENATTEAQNSSRPLVPSAAETLPVHLNMELTLFSRAKAIRSQGIKTASVEFSFVLAENLADTLTLLPGDYLFRKGSKVSRRVWLVDQGCVEVFVDGQSRKRLFPGDIIGIGWLASLPTDATQTARQKATMDWVSLSGTAIADVRIMSDCKLVSGLSNRSEVISLRKLHPQDMAQIQHSVQENEISYEEDRVRRSSRSLISDDQSCDDEASFCADDIISVVSNSHSHTMPSRKRSFKRQHRQNEINDDDDNVRRSTPSCWAEEEPRLLNRSYTDPEELVNLRRNISNRKLLAPGRHSEAESVAMDTQRSEVVAEKKPRQRGGTLAEKLERLNARIEEADQRKAQSKKTREESATEQTSQPQRGGTLAEKLDRLNSRIEEADKRNAQAELVHEKPSANRTHEEESSHRAPQGADQYARINQDLMEKLERLSARVEECFKITTELAKAREEEIAQKKALSDGTEKIQKGPSRPKNNGRGKPKKNQSAAQRRKNRNNKSKQTPPYKGPPADAPTQQKLMGTKAIQEHASKTTQESGKATQEQGDHDCGSSLCSSSLSESIREKKAHVALLRQRASERKISAASNCE